MALTVAEKEHWKERIGKRIEHRIETLVAKKDPTLLQRVAEQSRERAYNSLAIFAQHVELQQIEKQKAELDRRERRLKAEQKAIIRGTPVEQEMEDAYYRYENVVEDAVSARAKALEADILSESELGKQVLALRAEKDNLLDTVWLATSTSQVKELWEQVNALLQVTPTQLEDKALKIRPVQEE
jgi:hypothetical protein